MEIWGVFIQDGVPHVQQQAPVNLNQVLHEKERKPQVVNAPPHHAFIFGPRITEDLLECWWRRDRFLQQRWISSEDSRNTEEKRKMSGTKVISRSDWSWSCSWWAQSEWAGHGFYIRFLEKKFVISLFVFASFFIFLTISSALKVSWHLPLLPKELPGFVHTGTWTSQPSPLDWATTNYYLFTDFLNKSTRIKIPQFW